MAVTTQIISDTANKVVVLLTNVGEVADETNALKVDVSTLAHATSIINFDGAGNGKAFKRGETVDAGGTPGSAHIVVVNPSTLIVKNVTGTFADNDVLTGASSGAVFDQAGAITASVYRIALAKARWSVGGMTGILEWDATSNVDFLAMSGNGAWDMSNWPGSIPNNAGAGITGDVDLSTVNHTANDTYSIMLEFHKTSGYAKDQTLSI